MFEFFSNNMDEIWKLRLSYQK